MRVTTGSRGAGWTLFVLAGAAVAACATSGVVDDDVGTRDDGTESGDGADVSAGCTRDRDCDDRIACTIDHCVEGACRHDPCADCCPEGLQCLVGLGCGRAPTPCTTDDECRDEIRCTLDRCADGTLCEHLPQNGLCEDGEICFPAIGCIPEPPEACVSDDECFADRPCLGDWYCDPEFGCQFETPLDCDDGDACTADGCDDAEGGCTREPRDADADTYIDAACGGGDCDDGRAEVNPGATEEPCNGVDDDCDPATVETCCEPGPCTTSCGSAGMRDCNPDGTPGDCIPPEETCNAADDDCDGETDEDFGCVRGAGASCTTSCGTTGTQTCGADCAWSDCLPPVEVCGRGDDDCDGETDEGFACAAGSSGSCPASCGSTGTRGCLGDCTWDVCVPPAETCNGADDDCDGVTDEDDECVRGAVGSCPTSCGSTGTRTCGADCAWGSCTPPAEVCNGLDDDCDAATDEGFGCIAGAISTCPTSCGSTGTRTCLGDCRWDVCAPPAETCNGVDDDCDLACDDGFACCRGSTTPCSTLGWVGGTAVCRSDCGGWNESACHRCGNGVIDTGEQCDGTNLGIATCATVGGGFTGGTLACTAGCLFDTTACTTGSWDPSGVYGVTPARSYTCACIFTCYVNFDIRSLTFVDDGASLTIPRGVTGLPCSLVGASARSTRTISVTCTAPGSCNETYTLTGSFSSDTVWSGTFTARYSGSCFDCTAQTWSVSGTKL